MMAKIVTFLLLSSVAITFAAPLDRPADFETDGINHTYSIVFEIGEMPFQVGPVPFTVTLMKQVNKYEWVGDNEYELKKNMIFESNSIHNYSIETSMPFNQVDSVFFGWQDMNEIYGHVSDVNIKTAYLTETTPNQSHITKKYCPADLYPRNLAGSLASRELSAC